MTSLDVFGAEWSLRETWLWVRFRSVKDVVGYGGPLQRQEPQAVGVLTYEDAVAELAMALRSGALVAEGDRQLGERETIPKEVWSRAKWGRENDLVEDGYRGWTNVRIPRGQILSRWPDPEPAQKVRGRPGPKGRSFPHADLKRALEEGLRSGKFSLRDGPTRIARSLQDDERFKDWKRLVDQVSGFLPELRGIESEKPQVSDLDP
jgi:hypothetical protein